MHKYYFLSSIIISLFFLGCASKETQIPVVKSADYNMSRDDLFLKYFKLHMSRSECRGYQWGTLYKTELNKKPDKDKVEKSLVKYCHANGGEVLTSNELFKTHPFEAISKIGSYSTACINSLRPESYPEKLYCVKNQDVLFSYKLSNYPYIMNYKNEKILSNRIQELDIKSRTFNNKFKEDEVYYTTMLQLKDRPFISNINIFDSSKNALVENENGKYYFYLDHSQNYDSKTKQVVLKMKDKGRRHILVTDGSTATTEEFTNKPINKISYEFLISQYKNIDISKETTFSNGTNKLNKISFFNNNKSDYYVVLAEIISPNARKRIDKSCSLMNYPKGMSHNVWRPNQVDYNVDQQVASLNNIFKNNEREILNYRNADCKKKYIFTGELSKIIVYDNRINQVVYIAYTQ